MPTRKPENCDPGGYRVFSLDMKVLLEPLPFELQPLHFGSFSFRQLQVRCGRKRLLQVARIDVVGRYDPVEYPAVALPVIQRLVQPPQTALNASVTERPNEVRPAQAGFIHDPG